MIDYPTDILCFLTLSCKLCWENQNDYELGVPNMSYYFNKLASACTSTAANRRHYSHYQTCHLQLEKNSHTFRLNGALSEHVICFVLLGARKWWCRIVKATIFLHCSSGGVHCNNAVTEIWKFPAKNPTWILEFIGKLTVPFIPLRIFFLTSLVWSFLLGATLLDEAILFKPRRSCPLTSWQGGTAAFEVFRGASRSFRLVSGFLCSTQSVYLTVNKVPFT